MKRAPCCRVFQRTLGNGARAFVEVSVFKHFAPAAIMVHLGVLRFCAKLGRTAVSSKNGDILLSAKVARARFSTFRKAHAPLVAAAGNRFGSFRSFALLRKTRANSGYERSRFFYLFAPDCLLTRGGSNPEYNQLKRAPDRAPFSADDGIRTRDLVITNDVRYLLRYISVNVTIIADEGGDVNIFLRIF